MSEKKSVTKEIADILEGGLERLDDRTERLKGDAGLDDYLELYEGALDRIVYKNTTHELIDSLLSEVRNEISEGGKETYDYMEAYKRALDRINYDKMTLMTTDSLIRVMRDAGDQKDKVIKAIERTGKSYMEEVPRLDEGLLKKAEEIRKRCG